MSDEELLEYYNELKEYFETRKDEIDNNKWFKDLTKQINSYKESIKDYSHRVLIVAHSQGNLFTYQAYKLLELNSDTKWMTDYMYVISVASPLSSDIIPNTPVVCYDNDMVCKIGGHDGFENIVRGVGWYCTEHDPEDLLKEMCDEDVKSELSQHLFKENVGKLYKGYKSYEYTSGMDKSFGIHAFSFYMGEPLEKEKDKEEIEAFTKTTMSNTQSMNMILNYIKQGLDILSQKESMWKINKEPEDYSKCENIRVEMAHKFDNEIKNISNVYPFNTQEYKLYPVNGEYVIASECGGEEIKDFWDEKNDYECYLLSPINEIIKKKVNCGFDISYKDVHKFIDYDTFYNVGYNGCSCFPYYEYTFVVKYYDENGNLVESSWTAQRHRTMRWVDGCGDVLEIGNGAGGSWVHGGINLYVDMKE
jgi:hypothetical protein